MSDYVPQELLIKILVKLPPKPLIRFRCVSKSWNSLISSPYFISLHTQQTVMTSTKDGGRTIVRCYSKAQNSEVYSVHADDGDEGFSRLRDIRIEYPFRDVRFYYRIVGSCNGVFCLADDLFGPLRSVVLWNPSIRRKVKLPLPQATYNQDAPQSALALGFGFDSMSDDYKVVRMAFALNEDDRYVSPMDAEVYALSTGEWRKINRNGNQNCVVDYFWSQVYLHGNVHWIAYRLNQDQPMVEEDEEQGEFESLIMVFDIAREAFDEMPLPNSLKNEFPSEMNVTSVEQSIAVIHYSSRAWCQSFSIWVMTNYGDKASWSQRYSVNNLDGGIGMVLGVRVKERLLVTSKNGGLKSYDPFTGKGSDLGVLGTKNSFYVGPYVESLALLNEGTEAREITENEIEKDCDDDGNDDDDEIGEEYSIGDVEKSEFWMQASVTQYFAALLG